jgi:hypothetical protein
MMVSSGMTLAGALAAGVSGSGVGTAHPVLTATLLSDRLPAAALYVSISAPDYTVTQPIDRALRNALLRSTTLVSLL